MDYKMAYFEGDMEVGYYCVECKATTDNSFPEQHEPDCKYHDKHCKACPDWHKEVREYIRTTRKQAFLEAAEMVLNERCVQPEYVTSEIWYAQDLTKLLREKAEE